MIRHISIGHIHIELCGIFTLFCSMIFAPLFEVIGVLAFEYKVEPADFSILFELYQQITSPLESKKAIRRKRTKP